MFFISYKITLTEFRMSQFIKVQIKLVKQTLRSDPPAIYIPVHWHHESRKMKNFPGKFRLRIIFTQARSLFLIFLKIKKYTDIYQETELR